MGGVETNQAIPGGAASEQLSPKQLVGKTSSKQAFLEHLFREAVIAHHRRCESESKLLGMLSTMNVNIETQRIAMLSASDVLEELKQAEQKRVERQASLHWQGFCEFWAWLGNLYFMQTHPGNTCASEDCSCSR